MAGDAVLEVIAPGLFTPGPTSSGGADTAALSRVLARADSLNEPSASFYRNLFTRFGGAQAESSDPPLAALSMYAEGLNPGTEYWFCAQPVRLHADRDRLMLFLSGEPSGDDAGTLWAIQRFNSHFEDRGWQLTLSDRGHWYLKAPRPLQVMTSPPLQVAGHSVDGHLPRGPDETELRRLAAETEMLFHTFADREEAPLWNSLWLWGGGRLPERLGPAPPWVWTQDPAVEGMALLAGARLSNTPMTDDAALEPGIVLFQDLEIALAEDDANGFDDSMNRLNQLVMDAVAALRSRRLTELRVGDGVSPMRCIRRPMLWRWWRRERGLARFGCLSESTEAGNHRR